MIRPIRALIAVAALFAATSATAQTWPTKPVRLIVPYPPGASTDLVARAVGQRMSANVEQPVVVENRPGGNGTLGSELVARSAPDGYTFVLGTGATHSLVQMLSKNVPYDPVRDFTPITPAAGLPIALAVHPSVPAANAAELLRWAKANPGRNLSYGTPGIGSPHHLAGELLNQLAGGGLVHVAYKGSGPSITDLIAGHIPMAFSTLVSVLPHQQTGKVRIIGMTEAKRAKNAPSIPTIGESVPGYAIPPSWLGFFGPANLPAPILSRMHAELVKAITSPEVVAKLEQNGLEAMTATPEEYAAIIRKDMESFRRIIDAAGIKPE